MAKALPSSVVASVEAARHRVRLSHHRIAMAVEQLTGRTLERFEGDPSRWAREWRLFGWVVRIFHRPSCYPQRPYWLGLAYGHYAFGLARVGVMAWPPRRR